MIGAARGLRPELGRLQQRLRAAPANVAPCLSSPYVLAATPSGSHGPERFSYAAGMRHIPKTLSRQPCCCLTETIPREVAAQRVHGTVVRVNGTRATVDWSISQNRAWSSFGRRRNGYA